MKRLIALVLGLALSACVPGVSTVRSEVQEVPPAEIVVASSPDEAFDRVRAAFMKEGIGVVEADRQGGLVRSDWIDGGTVQVGGLMPVTGRVEHYIRATIIPEEQGSRIFLSVLGRSHMTGSRGTETTTEFPLAECVDVGHSDAYATCRETLARILAERDRVATAILDMIGLVEDELQRWMLRTPGSLPA